MSLARESISIAVVPTSLVKRLKRLRQEAAKSGLRIEAKWKLAKARPEGVPLTDEQREILEYIADLGAVTILDAANAFGMSIQAMGNRLQRLENRGLLVRDAGRPAKWRVKQGG